MTDPITELARENQAELDRRLGKAIDGVRLTVNPHLATCTCSAPMLIERGWPTEWVRHARSCPQR